MLGSPFLSFVDAAGKFPVTTRSGFHLACELDLPKAPRAAADTATVGVLCHGLYQTKESTTITAASEGLLAAPAVVDAVVRFDFHGEGESDGREHWSLGGYEDEVEDLRDVIVFLQNNRCCVQLILGHSRAASVVELYAHRYGQIPLVIAVAGRMDLNSGIEHHVFGATKSLLEQGKQATIKDPDGRDRKITNECIKRRASINMEKTLAELRDDPKEVKAICLIHGLKDRAIPAGDSKKAFEILNTKTAEDKHIAVELHLLDNCEHDVGRMKNINEYFTVLRRFVECDIVKQIAQK